MSVPYGPPPPEGEPIYVPEPFPAPGYGPAPYQPALYSQPTYPQPVVRRSEPRWGWALFAVGVLIAVSSLLPWAVFFGVSIDGTGGDGTLTALCAIVISAVGLIIGLGQGLLWSPLTAMGCSVLVTITAVADVENVTRFVPGSADAFSADAVAVGPGLWLTLIAGVLGIVVSSVALLRRS
jgi:hypothetical protein